MKTTGISLRSLALSIVCLVMLGVPGARGEEDVWRIAGTFNGWNTNDDRWALEPVEGEDGVYAVERRLAAGDYRFKFVKNGAWDEHFGRATGNALEQPGVDIPLLIPMHAMYRITLDEPGRAWKLDAVDLKAPIPVVRIRGVPTLGRMFEIDMRESLTKNPHEQCGAVIVSPGTVHRIRRAKDDALRYGVIPSDDGKFLLNIRLIDGMEENAPETMREFVIFIAQRYYLSLEFVGDSGEMLQEKIVVWPYGNDVYRVIVEIPEDGVLNAADLVLEGKKEDTVLVRGNGRVRRGTYLAEIADGQIRLNPDQRVSPKTLIPGNWTKFHLGLLGPSHSFPPAEVHLTGDFNSWAGPGQPGAIRMTTRPEARFETILDLPEGAYRYQFVYDGTAHPDPDLKRRRAEGLDGTPASVLIVGRTPEDFDAPKPDDINSDAVRHDPASALSFVPISRGLGLADLAVTTLPGDADGVICYATAADPADPDATRTIEIPMRRSTDHAGFDRWTARVKTGLPEFTYTFSILDGDFEHTTETFRATIPDDPMQIPDWAKGAVWYQIFPERFRNGNPMNDPHGPSVFLMDWDAHWYEISPEEERAWRERYAVAPGETFAERTGGPLFHVVYDRRYGGDLQGVEEKLDELKELGVTAIYFNPVFEAESMHKYDATDFRHIDDNLATPESAGRVPAAWTTPDGEELDPATWTWTPADRYFIEEFLPAARERGIRVVIDGVFNHTGRPFFAFRDLREKGRDSAYADWYYAEFGEDGSLESWTAWDGPSGWLPKFKQTESGDLVAPVKQHLFDITSRWMDPNADGDPSDGIDGWRLDVPLDIGGSLGAPFWRDWRDHVKGINPDAVIIAEIWGEEEASAFMSGDHFDTQMHYPFATAVTEWLAVRPGMSSQDLINDFNSSFDEPPQTNLIHQNLFGSHDTDRYVSKLHNPGREYDGGNRIQDGAVYKEERPTDDIYTLSLLGVAIQATYLGAPMVYYGDEYGMWGADDPSDRKPVPWPDTGRNRNPTDNPLRGLRKHYVEWFGLRHDPTIGPILRFGDVQHLDSGDPGVLAFVRSLNGMSVYVVANRNAEPYDAEGLLPAGQDNPRVGGVEARYWLIEN